MGVEDYRSTPFLPFEKVTDHLVKRGSLTFARDLRLLPARVSWTGRNTLSGFLRRLRALRRHIQEREHQEHV
jgi:hypothetical protein